jgi:HAT1-interacting factor 1
LRVLAILTELLHRDTSATTEAPTRTIDEEVELARRAFALRQYEQAVDHYATALELQCVQDPVTCRQSLIHLGCRTEKFGDRAPENADLYLAYGKALLEHAITQSSVLGKQGAEGEEDDSDDEENPGMYLWSFRPHCAR